MLLVTADGARTGASALSTSNEPLQIVFLDTARLGQLFSAAVYD